MRTSSDSKRLSIRRRKTSDLFIVHNIPSSYYGLMNSKETEIARLAVSDEYADFIIEQSKGDRPICNGDMLIEAMEDGYLFDEFLASIGYTS